MYDILCMIYNKCILCPSVESFFKNILTHVCLTYSADLEVRQSKTKPLQDVKVASLRDAVSTTCNLVRKHWEHVVQEFKWN